MWKERIERIREHEKRFNVELNTPITEGEIVVFIQNVKDKLNYDLPDDYISFLRIVNGLYFDGYYFCGDDVALQKTGYDPENLLGFISMNLLRFKDIPGTKDRFIFYG